MPILPQILDPLASSQTLPHAAEKAARLVARERRAPRAGGLCALPRELATAPVGNALVRSQRGGEAREPLLL